MDNPEELLRHLYEQLLLRQQQEQASQRVREGVIFNPDPFKTGLTVSSVDGFDAVYEQGLFNCGHPMKFNTKYKAIMNYGGVSWMGAHACSKCLRSCYGCNVNVCIRGIPDGHMFDLAEDDKIKKVWLCMNCFTEYTKENVWTALARLGRVLLGRE